MSVIQRRSTATPTVSTTVALAVVLIIVIAIVIFLYCKSRGPFRRSPSPAITLSTNQPTSRPASWFQPIFPKLPESPQSPRPWREAQNAPMRSELHNTPHRNYGQPVPGTANSNTPVQGSATRSNTRTTQPLPGTSSTVTMFKIPTSEPVRPLPPTPSKLPPVRKATPTNTNGVPYLPQSVYISPSSTATATRTRTASNTPSPPPQQPHLANRSLTSTSTLRNPTSHKTLRNLFSSSTVHAPLSTFNSQSRTLRSPISDRDIQPPPKTHQDHPALRHPASSPSLPYNKPTDIPPTLLQPLPFPLTSDTTDLSTELANPHEQATLGYKNTITTTIRQAHQPNNNNQTSPTPTQSQSQPHIKPSSSSSRPLVNSTYANFLTTRMQTHTSSSSGLSPHSASLAALLVGSEAGTTDAGTTDAGGGRTPDMNNNNNKSTESDPHPPTITSPISTTSDAMRNHVGGRFYNSNHGRRGERNADTEVEERYKRFKDTGDFADRSGGDDDPVGRPWGRFGGDDDLVGRPWGRFDGKSEMGGEMEMERGRGRGRGDGIGPLRIQVKKFG